MDINTLRAIATVLSMATFVGIVWWAWSRQRDADFAEAANLPFEQD
jgi:cytochrome c oxidase cbb3-type subunit IV